MFASGKLSLDERMELERGLSSEMANAKMQLPRSKKALTYSSDGHIDDAAWQKAQREFGIAARVGDQIQITRVVIEADTAGMITSRSARRSARLTQPTRMPTRMPPRVP